MNSCQKIFDKVKYTHFFQSRFTYSERNSQRKNEINKSMLREFFFRIHKTVFREMFVESKECFFPTLVHLRI